LVLKKVHRRIINIMEASGVIVPKGRAFGADRPAEGAWNGRVAGRAGTARSPQGGRDIVLPIPSQTRLGGYT
jgi:hypothetical protein